MTAMRAAVFGLCVLAVAACSDDPATPGTLEVSWTLGRVATCDIINVTSIEARAIRGDEEFAMSADCSAGESSGLLTIDGLAPGKYTVEVGGFNAGGRETYLGVGARTMTVPDGGLASTDPITLKEKGATLLIDWDLPGGKRCAQASVGEVTVSLFTSRGNPLEDDQNNPALAPTTVPCDNVYTHPEDPERTGLFGTAYTGIEPIDGLVVVIDGLDVVDGETVVATGQSEATNLGAGEEVPVVVALEDCPAEGCTP